MVDSGHTRSELFFAVEATTTRVARIRNETATNAGYWLSAATLDSTVLDTTTLDMMPLDFQGATEVEPENLALALERAFVAPRRPQTTPTMHACKFFTQIISTPLSVEGLVSGPSAHHAGSSPVLAKKDAELAE